MKRHPFGAGIPGLAALVAASLAVVCGCASPRQSPSPPPVAPGSPASAAPSKPAVSATDPLEAPLAAWRRSEPGAVAALVRVAFDQAGEPGFRRRWLQAVAGHEGALLATALEQASHEAREVGPVLRGLAAALGRDGSDAVRQATVREIANRECCLRRSFLAAALDGLADGIEAAPAAPAPDTESAVRLEELAGSNDAGVEAAARRVARYYPVGRVEPVPAP